MPIIQITLVKGRDREVVQDCIKQVAQTVSDALGAPLESIRVAVTECEPELFAVGTTLKSESR